MNALFAMLVIISLLVACGFLAAFIWAVRTGQFEDTSTPAMRILQDSESPPRKRPNEEA